MLLQQFLPSTRRIWNELFNKELVSDIFQQESAPGEQGAWGNELSPITLRNVEQF